MPQYTITVEHVSLRKSRNATAPERTGTACGSFCAFSLFTHCVCVASLLVKVSERSCWRVVCSADDLSQWHAALPPLLGLTKAGGIGGSANNRWEVYAHEKQDARKCLPIVSTNLSHCTARASSAVDVNALLAVDDRDANTVRDALQKFLTPLFESRSVCGADCTRVLLNTDAGKANVADDRLFSRFDCRRRTLKAI